MAITVVLLTLIDIKVLKCDAPTKLGFMRFLSDIHRLQSPHFRLLRTDDWTKVRYLVFY